MHAKLKSVKTEMRRRMHHSIPEQGRWLASVLQGHYRDYAVPDNSEGMQGFRRRVIWHWRSALTSHAAVEKGGQPGSGSTAALAMATGTRILHPWPDRRFDAKTRGRSPVG